MKTLSITIEESLLRELDRGIKAVSMKGRSEAIRVAVRQWLGEIERKKKIQREIEGYKKKPVKPEEFGRLLSLQELPK
jgi:metal-responsive CopG/Arc/MetJ family transcriptional regulator